MTKAHLVHLLQFQGNLVETIQELLQPRALQRLVLLLLLVPECADLCKVRCTTQEFLFALLIVLQNGQIWPGVLHLLWGFVSTSPNERKC